MCENRMGFGNEYYLDEKVYVRINLPFEKARLGRASNKPYGSLLQRLRWMIKTPPWKHNLVEYNRGRPRATWGHGPHIDTWYGHSFTATNLWFSIAGTNTESTMILYPDSMKMKVPFNEATMYRSDNVALRNPVELALEPGENFVFHPEMLHSTRINSSDETRVVITLRVSETEPTFSESTHHAIYDKWLFSNDVREGRQEARQVGIKIPEPEYTEYDIPEPVSIALGQDSFTSSTTVTAAAVAEATENIPFELTIGGKLFTGVKREGTLYVLSSTCPHLGAGFERGSVVGNNIRCPEHGLLFDMESGRSNCASLKIRTEQFELV